MSQSLPVSFSVPDGGVYFAESVHARDFIMPERVDPFHKLIFVQRGRIELRTQSGEATVAEMGDERALLAVPAGVRHRILDEVPSVILVLGLGDGFLRQDQVMWDIWERIQERPVSARVMEGGFAGWWRRAMVEQTQQGRAYGLTLRAMAMQMLVAADRNVTEPGTTRTEQRVRLVMRRMRETFFEDWTIERAAERTGLSRRQFTQRFREIAGASFVQYLTSLRLAHAEHLLLGRHHGVTGAALSAGFADLSHFYRLFRQKHGQPPLQWLAGQK
jgi:AraC-like DNA-binding protein